MVRFMAAGMSLITCRQAVVDSLTNNITKAFSLALRLTDAVSGLTPNQLVCCFCM